LRGLPTDEDLVGIGGAARESAARMLRDLETSAEDVARLRTGEVLYKFLQASGLLGRWSREASAEAEAKVKNVARFFDTVRAYGEAAEHDRVPAFVEHLDLLREAGDDPAVAEAAPDDATKAAVTREVWEYDVDATVKRVFDAIVRVETRLPGVLSGQRAIEVPIGNIGLTPGDLGPRPHDPRDIAWYSSNPRGAPFNDFMDRIKDQLSDVSATERISPELADAVHGIQGQTRGISVSVGTDAAAVDISWERIAPTLELKLCGNDGSCVTVIVKKEGNYVQVTYEGVTDRHNVSLPTREQARGMDLEWRANGREGADAYAQWLRSRRLGTVEYLGGSQTGCQTGYILSCVRIEGTSMLACQLHCR
ncbi:MAG TPA: hypothetical protein VJ724_09150, partial [Tahibacter sp.]|nr:hypothetical protein [Tahibacter sp.]